MTAPELDPFPDPTPNALQAFRGRARGAALLLARGSAGIAAPQPVDPDEGYFCVEVRLIEDAQNTVTFIPLDDRGCPGENEVTTLRHESKLHSDGAVSTITNVALQAPVKSAPLPEGGGVLGHVNDGDRETSVRFKFWDWDIPDASRCDAFAWIQIDLAKPYTVSQVNLHWGKAAGAPYATCYAVLVSSETAPGEPIPTSFDWKVVAQKEGAEAGVQELSIDPEVARSVAVLLYENASTGLSEEFEVGEIEIMGQDPNAVPPPPPDYCE